MCVCLVLYHPQLNMVRSCNPILIMYLQCQGLSLLQGRKGGEGAHVMSRQLLCTVCRPLPWVTSTDPQHLADAPSLQPFSSMYLAS